MSAMDLIEQLRELPNSASEEHFWAEFLSCLKELCRARQALAVQQDESGAWQLVGAEGDLAALPTDLAAVVGADGQRALSQGYAYRHDQDADGRLRSVLLVRSGSRHDLLLLLCLPGRERSHMNELLLRAQLVADIPERRTKDSVSSSDEPQQGQERDVFLDFLDMVGSVMEEADFGPACLALVNGLTERLGCAQVALGWRQDGYVRTQCISHLSRFDQKTENIRLLEAAFEEAADQESLLAYPDDADGPRIILAHERLCRTLGYQRVLSLPLRAGRGDVTAVLAISEQEPSLDDQRILELQCALGLLLPWLQELKQRDGWWGVRLWRDLRCRMSRLLGADYFWQKVLALSLAPILMYIVFGTWDFRLEAGMQLVTDSTRQLGAPYDGHVDTIYASVGDEVTKGAILARLDVQDLALQEVGIRAKMRSLRADADKARAGNSLADMEIANARYAQAQADLERLIYNRNQAEIKAPFAGVVVEGERKDLLGAPVHKGDRLFRLARIEGLYAQLLLPEEDIQYVTVGAVGTIALLAQPENHISFHIKKVIPMARVEGQKGNHFLIKAELTDPVQPWWRPGMSGIARIDAGRKPIIWLWTYRLIDTMRLRFWL